MIVLGGPRDADRLYDVCVVGAGPAGLAAAFACAERGRSVAILEAGGLKAGPVSYLSLNNITPHAHDTIEVILRAGLGGTSSAWGGTCVPYDPADFADQWWDRSVSWPIAFSEMAAWYREAAQFLGLHGAADFEDGYGAVGDTLDLAQCHRLAAQPNVGKHYEDALRRSGTIDLFLETALTALRCDAQGVRVAVAETESPRGRGTIRAEQFVLAGGGLASTQMLLRLANEWPRHFQGGRAPLGRYYMGHLTGMIATLVFDRPAEAANFLYASHGRNVWRQRRIKIRPEIRARNELLNTAFVLRAPDLDDHRHRNGALSAVSLAKPILAPLRRSGSASWRAVDKARSGGVDTWKHVQNIVRNPIGTIIDFGRLAALSRTKNMPRLLLNAGGRYALDYHAEQIADPASRVYLDPGSPQHLTVDFKFVPHDLASVVQSHHVLDEALRAAKIGHLEYGPGPAERADSVRMQALDGYHQLGTTRMSSNPSEGVVDRDCRVFGFDNLYVASSSVFPTSGSANPTLTTVALARRLGHHLTADSSR